MRREARPSATGLLPGHYCPCFTCSRRCSAIAKRTAAVVLRVSVEASSLLTVLNMAFTPFPPDCSPLVRIMAGTRTKPPQLPLSQSGEGNSRIEMRHGRDARNLLFPRLQERIAGDGASANARRSSPAPSKWGVRSFCSPPPSLPRALLLRLRPRLRELVQAAWLATPRATQLSVTRNGLHTPVR